MSFIPDLEDDDRLEQYDGQVDNEHSVPRDAVTHKLFKKDRAYTFGVKSYGTAHIQLGTKFYLNGRVKYDEPHRT